MVSTEQGGSTSQPESPRLHVHRYRIQMHSSVHGKHTIPSLSITIPGRSIQRVFDENHTKLPLQHSIVGET